MIKLILVVFTLFSCVFCNLLALGDLIESVLVDSSTVPTHRNYESMNIEAVDRIGQGLYDFGYFVCDEVLEIPRTPEQGSQIYYFKQALLLLLVYKFMAPDFRDPLLKYHRGQESL